MQLQRFTMGRMPIFAKVVHGTHNIAKVSRGSLGTMAPLAPCEPGRVTMPILTHSSMTHFP
jgi:hypothetical protein